MNLQINLININVLKILHLQTHANIIYLHFFKGFQGAIVLKNLPVNTGDITDGGLIPGAGMATHSSILAWRIPWTEDLVSYSP